MENILSQHSLKKIQAAGGLSFAALLCLYLYNSFDSKYGRLYYHKPYIESAGIFGALGIHLLSNILILYRRYLKVTGRDNRIELTPPPFIVLQRYTGYIILVSVISYLLVASMRFDVRSISLLSLLFCIFLGSNAIYHISNGILEATEILGIRKSEPRSFTRDLIDKFFKAMVFLMAFTAVSYILNSYPDWLETVIPFAIKTRLEL